MVKSFFIFIFIGFSLVIATLKFVDSKVDKAPFFNVDYEKNRAHLQNIFIKNNLEKFKNSNVFLGMSAWTFFLNPKNYKSNNITFNMSYPGLVGNSSIAYTEYLKQSLGNIKVNKVFIEFSPLMFSKYFSRDKKYLFDIAFPKVFLDKTNTYNFLFSDFPMNLKMYLDINLNFFYFSTININYGSIFYRKFVSDKYKFYNIFTDSKWKEVPEWNDKYLGFSNWNQDLNDTTRADVKAFFEFLRKDEIKSKMNKSYEFMFFAGNDKIVFDQELIDAYLQSIKNVKAISKEVVLVVMPYSPTFRNLIKYKIEYKELLKNISKKSNVQFLDFSNFGEADSQFPDPIHPGFELTNNILNEISKQYE